MTRAARLIELGKPLRVEDVSLPEPGADEVVVDLAFAGVNPVDRYIAEGRVAGDGPLPRTLGSEASGHLGAKPVLAFGAELGARRDGIWAEAAVVPRELVYDLPPGVSLDAAAAMGVAGLTAWNVIGLAEVSAADRVLVLGASGGVGLPLVGLAASAGASVWGQTGSESKVAAVRAMGAESVVVTDAGGLAASAADLRPTVVIDSLGDGFTAAALSVMAPHGRLVIFGASAGVEGTLKLGELYRNGHRILGYAGLQITAEQRREGLEAALQALADGRLRIPIDRVWALDEVNEALGALSQRALTGKALLRLG